MRIIICLILFFIFTVSFSKEKADSLKTKLKAGATISLNSNGISVIPAFSLGKPAVMAEINLVKGRFSYDPILAYDLNLKPWVIDNWMRYKIIVKPSFELWAGMVVSSYNSEYQSSDELIWHSQRYFGYEMTTLYKFTQNSSLKFVYLNDRGQDEGTTKGHFVNLEGAKSEIYIGENVFLNVNFQLFYIDYEGKNDGLFIAPKISSMVRDIPFFIYFQAVQPLHSNMSTSPGFRWNLGLAYSL
jgi:hypothetical protein